MGNIIELKPTKTNKTYSRDYYNFIGKMINKMNKEVSKDIDKVFEKIGERQNANDSISSKKMTISFKYLLNDFSSVFTTLKNWQKKFNKISQPFSEEFVNSISKYTTNETENNIKNILGDKGIKVNKDLINFLEIKSDIIKENVDLIKSVPKEYHQKLYEKIKTGAKDGRNLSVIYDELMKIGDMTDRRAKNIAIDQNNKITSIINNERLKQYGFNKSKWLHSGASKQPRHSHIQASGKIFDINKGCLIDDEYILPGQLINCKCISVPIIEI